MKVFISTGIFVVVVVVVVVEVEVVVVVLPEPTVMVKVCDGAPQVLPDPPQLLLTMQGRYVSGPLH